MGKSSWAGVKGWALLERRWEVGNRHKDTQEDEFTGREVERKTGALRKRLRMHCFEVKDGKSGKGLTREILRISAENQRRHSQRDRDACHPQRDTVVQWLFWGKDREMVDPEKSPYSPAKCKVRLSLCASVPVCSLPSGGGGGVGLMLTSVCRTILSKQCWSPISFLQVSVVSYLRALWSPNPFTLSWHIVQRIHALQGLAGFEGFYFFWEPFYLHKK